LDGVQQITSTQTALKFHLQFDFDKLIKTLFKYHYL
jgi:hypothetical protein